MKYLTLMLTMLLASNLTFAMGGKGDHQKRAERFQKELNLTDEQLAKVTEIRKKHHGDKDTKTNFKEIKKSFRDAMKDPKSSTADLTAKFEAFQKLREEHQRKKFAMMLEMREVLNPEQIEKFREMKKEHKKHRREKKS
jgi:Spy/CpxP family protein refolding chaperone